VQLDNTNNSELKYLLIKIFREYLEGFFSAMIRQSMKIFQQLTSSKWCQVTSILLFSTFAIAKSKISKF